MLYHTFSTQEEIDQEYNPRFLVHNTEELIQSYFNESQRVLREYENHQAVSYGPTAAETLDIFPAAEISSPVHIFFHGNPQTPLDCGLQRSSVASGRGLDVRWPSKLASLRTIWTTQMTFPTPKAR